MSSLGWRGLRIGRDPPPARPERVKSHHREEYGDRRELKRCAIERYPIASPRRDLRKCEQHQDEQRSRGSDDRERRERRRDERAPGERYHGEHRVPQDIPAAEDEVTLAER